VNACHHDYEVYANRWGDTKAICNRCGNEFSQPKRKKGERKWNDSQLYDMATYGKTKPTMGDTIAKVLKDSQIKKTHPQRSKCEKKEDCTDCGERDCPHQDKHHYLKTGCPTCTDPAKIEKALASMEAFNMFAGMIARV
jgi:hypothetical protein